MFQVDAFSRCVFAGNPAAVLVLHDWLSDDVMLNIANENNLAETAFVIREGGRWALRWFTPVHEVDFCGHATLATAHVLFQHLGETGALEFSTRVGALKVSQTSNGYALDIPAFEPKPLKPGDPDLSALSAGQLVGSFRNFENLFAVFPDEASVRAFTPDLAEIAKLFPCGFAITAEGTETDFVSRYFAPGAGIPEDPVTGSTHATLVPYWADRLGRLDLTAHQASARGGDLVCRLREDRVILEGDCATFMKAEIAIGS